MRTGAVKQISERNIHIVTDGVVAFNETWPVSLLFHKLGWLNVTDDFVAEMCGRSTVNRFVEKQLSIIPRIKRGRAKLSQWSLL